MTYTTPEEHAHSVAQRTAQAIIKKYMRGQEEHGGKLWLQECLSKAREETIDLVVYLDVTTEQITYIKDFINKAMNDPNINKELALTTIANIITTGNCLGEK